MRKTETTVEWLSKQLLRSDAYLAGVDRVVELSLVLAFVFSFGLVRNSILQMIHRQHTTLTMNKHQQNILYYFHRNNISPFIDNSNSGRFGDLRPRVAGSNLTPTAT